MKKKLIEGLLRNFKSSSMEVKEERERKIK